MTTNQQESINEQQEIINDLRYFLSRANDEFILNKTKETWAAKSKAAKSYDKAVENLANFKKWNNL